MQTCDEWQSVCQRLAANELVTLVITGSSSKLSSEGIATQFRGRSRTHEMLPLSFAESLLFHEESLPSEAMQPAGKGRAWSPQETSALQGLYDAYLLRGGFPDIQRDKAPDRIEILQGYVRDVVARDVAERTDRADISMATQLALFMLRNTSCESSLNGLVEQLHAAGYRIGWEKAARINRLCKKAGLYFEVGDYTTSFKPGSTDIPKTYAVDPGIAYAVSRASQQDVGKRLETAVYLELRRRLAGARTDAVTSYTVPGPRRQKVDFLVGEVWAGNMGSPAIYELIQVSASLTAPKTRTRELGSLDAAFAATGLTEGTIVTLDEEGFEQTQHGSVRIVPAWKWSLEH